MLNFFNLDTLLSFYLFTLSLIIVMLSCFELLRVFGVFNELTNFFFLQLNSILKIL
jgi:hypothetical protein